MDSSLFVSYSHLDLPWMQAVKKHLEGMLLGRCKVWTDEEIAPGSSWEQVLRGNLGQAAAALVLVSPDYLVSPWCRAELKALTEAHQRGRVRAVYWILLQPCGWQWSELAQLQAVQEPPTRALLDLPEGPERQAMLLACCERVAGGTAKIAETEDAALAVVRRLLRDANCEIEIPAQAAAIKGDFSIVCRGLLKNGDDIYVKVLTNTPLHSMRGLFRRVSEACSTIHHPAVIRVSEVLTVGSGYDQRIVILSDKAHGQALAEVLRQDQDRTPDERHFTPDRVRVLVLRIAEALCLLHQLPPVPWQDDGAVAYTHLMGPLVPHNIFYDPVTMRPQISLVGVTNFLWHFFDAPTFQRIVAPASGTYLLPEKARTQQPMAPEQPMSRAEQLAGDQYFLGLLALQLLEAKELFRQPPGTAPIDPRLYLRSKADWRWARRHAQWFDLIERLLAPEPGQRFPDMDTVVTELRALEENPRAIAKYSYREYIASAAGGMEFSRRFYTDLFARAPALRELFQHAQALRLGASAAQTAVLPDDAHHAKLLLSLQSVLNFRRGAAPTAIDSVTAAHARFRLTLPQFEAFEASFLDTLAHFMSRTAHGRDEVAEVQKAWHELFAPVTRAMLAPPA